MIILANANDNQNKGQESKEETRQYPGTPSYGATPGYTHQPYPRPPYQGTVPPTTFPGAHPQTHTFPGFTGSGGTTTPTFTPPPPGTTFTTPGGTPISPGTMPTFTTPSGAPITPGAVPLPAVQQSYIENILRMNLEKVATVYMTFEHEGGHESKAFRGEIEAAGRDHVIINDNKTGTRYLLPLIYLDYVTFQGPINYYYPFG